MRVGNLLVLRKEFDAIGIVLARQFHDYEQPLLILHISKIKSGYATSTRVLSGNKIEIMTLGFLEKMYEVVS